jgi:hypothetical protein
MILLAGGREEERMINSRSTGRPLIVQPPTITVSVCLVGGWRINDNLKWRRTTILFAREEEWTKQLYPRNPAQRMEPHQIAWLTRLTRVQRRQWRRGQATSFGRLMKAMAINNGNSYIQWQRLSTTGIDNSY